MSEYIAARKFKYGIQGGAISKEVNEGEKITDMDPETAKMLLSEGGFLKLSIEPDYKARILGAVSPRLKEIVDKIPASELKSMVESVPGDNLDEKVNMVAGTMNDAYDKAAPPEEPPAEEPPVATKKGKKKGK